VTTPTLILLLLLAAPEPCSYWIDPCTEKASRATGCKTGDPELAKWAFQAWARESGGLLTFVKSESEEHARIRLRWAGNQGSLYGEAQPVMVDGKRGAVIYVLPATGRPGDDPLLRDTMVYLTCLHESGHALGLKHTAEFADIMYNFRYGGDLVEYFARYRRLLKTRKDIAQHSGVSEPDRIALPLALKEATR
jgi:hypothetical protein